MKKQFLAFGAALCLFIAACDDKKRDTTPELSLCINGATNADNSRWTKRDEDHVSEYAVGEEGVTWKLYDLRQSVIQLFTRRKPTPGEASDAAPIARSSGPLGAEMKKHIQHCLLAAAR